MSRSCSAVRRPGRRVGLVAAAVLAGFCVAAPVAAAAKTTPRPVKQFYLSLGDSYAVGTADPPHTTTNGYPNMLVRLAKAKGYGYTLVNLGCGGATTTSMLNPTAAQRAIGCAPAALMPGAANYPGQSQMQAALALIRAHKGHVGLVTISIGGNDVDGCIATPATAVACVMANMPQAVVNLTTMVKELRAAGGPRMRIIGSTYPDVALGAWVREDIFGVTAPVLAVSSISSFADVINPGLRKAYAAAGATFVDVTAATGAYGPFLSTTIPTYGSVPVPVAKVCALTFFCKDLNIHMQPAGYRIIANLEYATLPKIR
jgi:lysophospholipase L1-like esterase